MTSRTLRPLHLKGDFVVVVVDQDMIDGLYNLISTLHTAQCLGVDLGLVSIDESQLMRVYDSVCMSIEDEEYAYIDEEGDYVFQIDIADLNEDEEGLDPTALRGCDIASPSEPSTDNNFAVEQGPAVLHPAPDLQVVSQSNPMPETPTHPAPSNLAYYNQAKTGLSGDVA